MATHIADDHWTAEVRLPITQDANDPLHQIIGRKPTKSLPWFVNVCRQRVRENGTELSAFSPTGTKGFHVPMKFAHFFGGNSHKFESDPTVTDHIIGGLAADQLFRARKWNEALTAYLRLAAADKISEKRKSDALHRAVRCAISMEDMERASDLARQIPIPSVRKTALMQILGAQRKWRQITDDYKLEDLTRWPFWQIASGAFERTKAHYFTKSAKAADADLKLALEYEPDSRTQVTIRTMRALNLETNLEDEEGALAIYRQNYEGKKSIGGADEFRSVHMAALIHSRNGRHDEALRTVEQVDLGKTRGYWRHATLLVLGDLHLAAERKDQARETWKKLTDDKSVNPSVSKSASAKLEAFNRN